MERAVAAAVSQPASSRGSLHARIRFRWAAVATICRARRTASMAATVPFSRPVASPFAFPRASPFASPFAWPFASPFFSPSARLAARAAFETLVPLPLHQVPEGHLEGGVPVEEGCHRHPIAKGAWGLQEVSRRHDLHRTARRMHFHAMRTHEAHDPDPLRPSLQQILQSSREAPVHPGRSQPTRRRAPGRPSPIRVSSAHSQRQSQARARSRDPARNPHRCRTLRPPRPSAARTAHQPPCRSHAHRSGPYNIGWPCESS